MLNRFLKKLSLLSILGGGCSMLGSCSSTQSEKLLDETPITIKIPSKISNDILSITLPKCAFFLNERERKALDKGELTTEKVVFNYDIYAYSGNINNKFECQAINPAGFRVLNELQPIYPLSSGQVMSGYDYLEKINDLLGKKIIEKKGKVQKRFVNKSQDMLLINGMPNQTIPFELTYMKYDGSYNRPSSYSYSVLTVVRDKFYFQYEFIILVPENKHGHNLPDYNTDFAEKFRDVIQRNENVLHHPKLIQGFVDNNERVVKFINGHSVLTK